MRILIATPLYPPEVAGAAVYAKELARRLSAQHAVTVVAYTHLPEPLPKVTVIPVDKRAPRRERLAAFRKALVVAARSADVVIAINGASVEWPVLRGVGKPVIFCIGDAAANARGGILERLALLRARAVIRSIPPRRPEILPLEPEPKDALAAYEKSWHAHLKELDSHFHE